MGTSINDLVYLLESILGCEQERGGDHVRYFLKVNGRIIATVKYSRSWRGNTQIDDSILSKQAKSMKCSNRTWKLLLQRQITKEKYFRELLERKEISEDEFVMLCNKN